MPPAECTDRAFCKIHLLSDDPISETLLPQLRNLTLLLLVHQSCYLRSLLWEAGRRLPRFVRDCNVADNDRAVPSSFRRFPLRNADAILQAVIADGAGLQLKLLRDKPVAVSLQPQLPDQLLVFMSAIGIAVVDDGVVTEEFFSYVNPEEPFDTFNTELTGISAETVASAPTFKELWPKMGQVSKVAPIDKLSVVITLILAFIVLHEQFTTKFIIGCILIGAGTLLMVL